MHLGRMRAHLRARAAATAGPGAECARIRDSDCGHHPPAKKGGPTGNLPAGPRARRALGTAQGAGAYSSFLTFAFERSCMLAEPKVPAPFSLRTGTAPSMATAKVL